MKKIFAGLLLLGMSQASITGRVRIDPVTRQLLDDSNRTVIFHGVNMVYKVPPYIPQGSNFDPELSVTDQDIEDLVRWGFNFVRLGVMWEAVERGPSQYNMTYLDEVEKLVNRLGEKGIYTLVDAHQDVLTRKFCGEGIPSFYAQDELLSHSCYQGYLPIISQYADICKSLEDYNFRKDTDGLPLIEDCQKHMFVQYYLSPESMSLFERLYYNTSTQSIQGNFVSFWQVVAERFASNPYVVGYDPLNEPFPSNMYTHPELVGVPGLFDREALQPLYSRVFNEAYLPAGGQKAMFFEPAQFPDFYGMEGGIIFNLGFTEAPGGANHTSLQVLNDHTHYYCWYSK
ncbi:hypothetical protein FGO68_gene8931 [Halteria grandinella]|uniref:Glycoside hydrolase family 5 domain-containing protein n=1 Tax=Halteria grandinella TaxID=5974 RepID=A0A8J8NU90_HALGN|nr:hypothetical protein FGO68_gene8931 [Halteria grandinella]